MAINVLQITIVPRDTATYQLNSALLRVLNTRQLEIIQMGAIASKTWNVHLCSAIMILLITVVDVSHYSLLISASTAIRQVTAHIIDVILTKSSEV